MGPGFTTKVDLSFVSGCLYTVVSLRVGSPASNYCSYNFLAAETREHPVHKLRTTVHASLATGDTDGNLKILSFLEPSS